jgi:hypothetical protein
VEYGVDLQLVVVLQHFVHVILRRMGKCVVEEGYRGCLIAAER